MILTKLSVLVFINYLYAVHSAIKSVVRIKQGLVRGQRAEDGNYSTFLGIPYATVDLDNPFGPAKEHLGFGDQIFEANDGFIQCPQREILAFGPSSYVNYTIRYKEDKKIVNDSLDCLSLNIHVPDRANVKNLLPVLVWIHGGVFAFENAGMSNPRTLMRHEILVVMINYRLGPYGFMCLNTPLLPGNQGLKDQHLALEWVRDNIASFGGNPDDVTVSGHSAGASSALLHLFSNKDKLFNKVIALSGTPLASGMFAAKDLDAAKKLAAYFGLYTDNDEDALRFLSKISPQLVVDASRQLDLRLRPCTEKSFEDVDNFITNEPYSVNNEEKIRNTPILISHTSKEQTGRLFEDYDVYYRDPFKYRIRDSFALDNEQLKEAEKITRHFFVGDRTIYRELRSEIEDFDGDLVLVHPIHMTIEKLLNNNANPIYLYVFSYIDIPDILGASHTADVKYLFYRRDKSFGNKIMAKLISNRLRTLVANFIKYGNPTPNVTDLLPVNWMPLTEDARPYLDIGTELQLKSRIFNDRLAFWDLFFDKYGQYQRFIHEKN